MNPQVDKSGNLNLPPPVVETQPLPVEAGVETAPFNNPEVAASPQEQAVKPTTPSFPALSTPIAPPQSNPPSSDASTTTTAQTVLPAIADDNDLIEKEWVIKAKEIVEKTREDPHRQSTDMTIFRADYMQKRYNKTIKLPE